MTTDANPRSPYPPVEVAVALAERSHALPGSSPTARARLAFVVALGAAEKWSEESQAALALREVDWRAVTRHLVGEPTDRLHRLDPAVLLAWLCETPNPPTEAVTSTPLTTADHPHERSR